MVWTLPHDGRVIELHGPSSQILSLEGDNLESAKVLAYETKDKEAQQIEVRARIVGAAGALGDIPVVRWYVEVAHGEAIWREPTPAFQVIAGTPMVSYSLPARGMVWRVNERQWRIGFRNQGMLAGGPLLASSVQVSVLPTCGSRSDVYPYQHLAAPAAGQHPFPMTAREWRVRDSNGRPFAPLAVSILFTGLLGALLGPVDASLLADFGPIPHDAVSWTPDVPPVYADFR